MAIATQRQKKKYLPSLPDIFSAVTRTTLIFFLAPLD